MAIAILTTLFLPQIHNISFIIIAIIIGGAIGYFIAVKVKMTEMPQLVAGFHSLVGLSAVFIAMAALWLPNSFNIIENDKIKNSSLIEMGIGLVIGGITFTGSIIAFLKLNGNISSRLVIFKNNPNRFAKIFSAILLVFLIYF